MNDIYYDTSKGHGCKSLAAHVLSVYANFYDINAVKNYFVARRNEVYYYVDICHTDFESH